MIPPDLIWGVMCVDTASGSWLTDVIVFLCALRASLDPAV